MEKMRKNRNILLKIISNFKKIKKKIYRTFDEILLKLRNKICNCT